MTSACPTDAYEIQMLHGMGEPIKQAIRGMGLRLREYAPVGELIPGMAYLVRRLLENTANDSFLRQTFVEGAAVDELVQPPLTSPDFGAPVRRRPRVAATDAGAPGALRQSAARRLLARRESRRLRRRARRGATSASARHYPLADRRRATSTPPSRLESVEPGQHRPRSSARSAYGGRAEAEAAVAAAQAAAPGAGATPRRATAPPCSFRAAELMRGEAFELAALMTLESGKTRRESDADVDEAIDFLEYYGREMLRLGRRGAWAACPASTTSTSTSRAASASSSRPGTSRSPSSPA